MGTTAIKKGPPLWVLPAGLFALAVNVLLLLLLPLLSHLRAPEADMTEPVGIQLVRIREKEPPPEEEEEREPPEEEKQEEMIEDFQPDLVQPKIQTPDMPALQFEVNTKLIDGAPTSGISMFFNAADLDHPPRALMKAPPLYPYKAKRLEIQGYVKVKFLVDETGLVSRITVLDAEPKGMFEESVLASLPNWKFSPGKVLGEPVSSWVTTTIRFELQ
jgi:protein TonB